MKTTELQKKYSLPDGVIFQLQGEGNVHHTFLHGHLYWAYLDTLQDELNNGSTVELYFKRYGYKCLESFEVIGDPMIYIP